MAANAGAGGRQGLNSEHVEFSVKAEEDLYLQGSENTIRRVTAETNYSCLMLKTQRFSSLFRHYAKYHGLRKDDLEYYFVNLLENEDTPESVQLQRGDTIMVRKRRKIELSEAAADDDEFFVDMKELLDDEEHMDAIFLVHTPSTSPKQRIKEDEKMEVDTKVAAQKIEIRAHKSVLTARAEYFKALFRTNPTGAKTKSSSSSSSSIGGTTTTLSETETSTIEVKSIFSEAQVRYVLEFVYTNRIADIQTIGTDDLLSILHLGDLWMLRDLKRLVEHELIQSHITLDSVARLYGATEDFSAKRLSRACMDFIMENLRELAGNTAFEEEMKNYPHLCIPVLKAAADLIPDGPAHKKQRTGEHHGTPNSAMAAAYRSSPVPDSDP